MAATQATNSLHKICSKTTLQSLQRSSSSPEFVSNADALPGNGLKRQLSCVDLGNKRKAAKQPLSRLGRSLPFVGVRLPQAKPKSKLHSIRLKNAQLGLQPAARAAGMQCCKTGGCLPCNQTQESQQRRAPRICTMMVLHSSSRTGLEQRHLPPPMQRAHSTKGSEAGQHRSGRQIPQPLLAMKG